MDAISIIEALGGPASVAAQVNARSNTVSTWKRRNRIPSEWWAPVVSAAQRSGLKVSLETLAGAEAPRRRGEA